MASTKLLAGALALALAAPQAPASQAQGRGLVAVRAGTIHAVEGDRVFEGGATMLVRAGKIVAVGNDVQVPADARVVDFGREAVVVPGLVAAYSRYAMGRPAQRTAQPSLSALDGFDFFTNQYSGLSGGVTSAYIAPAEGRLVAGAGAVVKLAGEDLPERVLRSGATIHGAIDSTARRTPGYWEPPIPATVDVGMDYMRPQLPRTTMGAIVALGELLEASRTGEGGPYGPTAGRDLARLVEGGAVWRIGATTAPEIRALLDFGRENGVQLVVDKAFEVGALADEVAAAGASVVYHVPFTPNTSARDQGKSPDARWWDYEGPAALSAAGVPFAIATMWPRDLFFAASLASRGGLSETDALRAVTLGPAEVLGVADRVGSLAPGKDGDFTVLSGPPFGGGGVLETWVGGERVWSPEMALRDDEDEDQRHRRARRSTTVVSVDELHVGDGEVLRPGELLISDGRIAEVGSRVSRPPGATLARAHAAMPGAIDALGHLGLEGSKKTPPADFALRTIVAPGDRVDRRVARAGVTTVVLAPRGGSKRGVPMMAYKPAATSFDDQVVEDAVALRVGWSERDRSGSGLAVRQLLAKGREYVEEWAEYEKKLAAWKPEPEDEPSAEAEEEEEGEDEDAEEEEDDKPKKKKKKKKGEEELEPDPLTGIWTASVERAPHPEPVPLKLRMVFEEHGASGAVVGNLRSKAVSGTLVDLEGWWDREKRHLALEGLGSQGWVGVSLELAEGKLAGTIDVGGNSIELEAERTEREFRVVGRPERGKQEEEAEPKGKPKEPKREADMEVLRRAMQGRATVVVDVDRSDEILDCVDAFEAAGIRPVLYGATDAHLVVDRLVGRIAGILLSPSILRYERERGALPRTPYADLQNAGIPVAFHSAAEEGAADLPVIAAYAVSQGMSAAGALRALTSDAAAMFAIGDRVGKLERGLDADVLLLDAAPLDPRARVERVWVGGVEVSQP